MVSTLKVTKIQIPNSDSDVISLDASTGNIAFNKPVTGTAMVKLLDATISSTVSEYNIGSTIITSTYDNYRVIADFMMDGEGRNLWIKAISGGSVVGGSVYARENAALSSSTYDASNATSLWTVCNITQFGNASGEGISIAVDFFNMTTTTKPASLTGRANSFSTGALHNSNVFGGVLLPTQVSTVLDGIQFRPDTGNISSGRVKVYGIS